MARGSLGCHEGVVVCYTAGVGDSFAYNIKLYVV
jgi:hypothetical protein